MAQRWRETFEQVTLGHIRSHLADLSAEDGFEVLPQGDYVRPGLVAFNKRHA